MDPNILSTRRLWSSCELVPASLQGSSGKETQRIQLEETLNQGPRPEAKDWPAGCGLCESGEGVLFALAHAAEQRDRHAAGHCERLAFVSVALGMAMGLERFSLLALYRGGYLHDVGKMGIPDSILFKTGALTAEEWVVMRSHPSRGEAICSYLPWLGPALPVIRHHHERLDGSGYPDGLAGDRIPLLARVLQIADIYDALVSQRPYKASFPPSQALETIASETDRGWRDRDIVELFLRIHDSLMIRMADYIGQVDGELQHIRSSLDNLQQYLTWAGATSA